MRQSSIFKISWIVLSILVFGFFWMSGLARADIISHVPNDGVPPVVKSPPGDPVAVGGIVGAAFIGYGVDYSYGNKEGIFDNGGGDEGAFSGLDASDVLDLLSPVDAKIVVPGTTTPGVTSYLSVEAGISDDGNLLLEVFNTTGQLITSVPNGPPLGTHGRTTMTVDRGGQYDIAAFRVTTLQQDYFGVDQVDIERPKSVQASVPTFSEGGIAVFLLMMAGSALILLRRKRMG